MNGKALLKLQEVDQTLMKIAKDIKQKELVLSLKEKQLAINKLQSILDREVEEKTNLEKKAAEIEKELAVLEAKKRQLEEKLYGSNTTLIKEIEGMRDRLQQFQSKINQIEDKVLSLMDQVEDKTQIINKIKGQLNQLKEEYVKGVKKYNLNKRNLQQEIEDLQARRWNIINSLSEEVLARYQKLQERFKYTGIAKVNGTCCSGCRIEIPILKLRSIKNGDNVEYCEYCGRLLIDAETEN
ncbi:MAG: hypothetical protein GXY91_04855 [Clostridia bacterium]|nr:hypothetical protein [Clostridia bacterium]